MARQDISYDFEDFGMTAAQLDEKYNPDGTGQHPEYTRDKWQHEVAEDNSSRGYWDWVASMIEQDDDDIQGEPATQEAPPTIQDTNQFASLMARWHIQGMKQAEHMLEMPEGHEAEYQANENAEPVRIVLTGDALIAFRMGVMTGADCFANLPFTYSLDEAAGDDDAPQGE